MRFVLTVTGFLVIFTQMMAAAENGTSIGKNWYQFRGPGSDQIPKVSTLPVKWGEKENVKWRCAIPGSGWSSPIIWGDRVFVSTAVSDDPSLEQRSYLAGRQGGSSGGGGKPETAYSYELHCLDLETGKLLWKQVAFKGVPFLPTRQDNTHANETPVTDGERIYVYFGMIGLYCYDFDGNKVWEKNLGAYPTESTWGAATSPMLFDNCLYMQIDHEEQSFLLALDAPSGNEIWRKLRDDKTSFSTPVIWQNSVRTEIVASGQKARGYDPATGEIYWELDLGGGRTISSPLVVGDVCYVGNEGRTDGGGTLFAVNAGASGDITPEKGRTTSPGVIWSVPDAGISMASPLFCAERIYLADRRGGFMHCYDAATGNAVYQRARIPGARAFWATPWSYGGKVFCLDDAGTTFVIEPGNAMNVLYKNEIDDKFWASAAFAEGAVILRGVKELYCISQ